MALVARTAPARILIVEDEPLLRLVNADMLSEAGFDVIEAANADEALRFLETLPDIAVVFTDVEMPGALDGFALAARIETRWPDIGVVITSGRRFPEAAMTAPTRCFVPKPFQAAHLVGVIDAVVQARH